MRFRFRFRPSRVQVNMRVAQHVGPVKKSQRLPGSFLKDGFTAWSVIDHHEREGSGVREQPSEARQPKAVTETIFRQTATMR